MEEMKEELSIGEKEDAEEVKSGERPKLEEFGCKNGRGSPEQVQS